MSGETEKEVSGWTTDTLREFFVRLFDEQDRRFEQRFSERDHRYEQRFEAQERAIEEAAKAAEKASTLLEENAKQWREAANEWRGAMTDRERNYLPRSEAQVLDEQNAKSMKVLIDRFDKLEDRFNDRESQRKGVLSAASVIPVVIGALLAILGVVSYFNGAP